MIERAWLVAGLGLGDEGKGSIVDWLVRRQRAGIVIRYNGGSQAAHHVVTRDGREHCFAQFGAGTLVGGVRTFLSGFVVVDPLALVAEERTLQAIGVRDAYARLTIAPACVIVTPFHRIVNQMRELARGRDRHGSCGLGIGEARLDSERPGMPSVQISDTLDRQRLRDKLQLLWLTKLDQAEQIADTAPRAHADIVAGALADLRRRDRVDGLADAYNDFVRASGIHVAEHPIPPGTATSDRTAVFEGAQGVLLDRDHGFWPHVTPSRTTYDHALAVLDALGGSRRIVRVGVTRAYATRHGAGPLPTQDRELGQLRPDRHNGTHPWQGSFRLGWFDAVTARHAVRTIGRIDEIVVTNLDRLAGLDTVRMCTAYHSPAGQIVSDLSAVAPGDIDARTRLTHWLARCRPRYIEFPGGWGEGRFPPGEAARGFLDALHSQAFKDARMTTVSTGPTADDKWSML